MFFLVFALVLLLMYLAIRRGWAAPGLISGVGVLASIVAMVLYSLAQGNSILQAVVVGIVVGALFSGAVLAIAWYFHNNEIRSRYAAGQAPPTYYTSPPNPVEEDEDY